jgi:hypothetical protein
MERWRKKGGIYHVGECVAKVEGERNGVCGEDGGEC